MAVVYDDMYLEPMGAFRRMKMSHLIADSDEELHAMADLIGVARRWHQAPPKASHSHYDIAMCKREQAIEAGAIPITLRQCSAMCSRRRLTGQLGLPDEALDWLRSWREAHAAEKAAAEPAVSIEPQPGI